jgi:hypothetical protein
MNRLALRRIPGIKRLDLGWIPGMKKARPTTDFRYENAGLMTEPRYKKGLTQPEFQV